MAHLLKPSLGVSQNVEKMIEQTRLPEPDILDVLVKGGESHGKGVGEVKRSRGKGKVGQRNQTSSTTWEALTCFGCGPTHLEKDCPSGEQ